MKLFANVTTFQISLAAMAFVGYGLLADQSLVFYVALGIVLFERVFLQGMVWIAQQKAQQMAMQAQELIKFQMEEMGKAFESQGHDGPNPADHLRKLFGIPDNDEEED